MKALTKINNAMMFKCAVLCVVLCANVMFQNTSAATPWEQFLQSPNEKQLNFLVGAIHSCNNVTCRNSVMPSSDQLDRLLLLDSIGNNSAIVLSINVLPILDGGGYEDTAVAIGNVLDKHPQLVLRTVKSYKVSNSEFRDILCILSPDITDSATGPHDLFTARLKALSSINAPSLVKLKQDAIETIKQCAKSYNVDLKTRENESVLMKPTRPRPAPTTRTIASPASPSPPLNPGPSVTTPTMTSPDSQTI